MRYTEEEAVALQRHSAKELARALNQSTTPAVEARTVSMPPKKTKYRNKRTERHGLKFDSKLEADWFDHLRLLYRAGEVLWFVRQVNFELPGGVRYRADYVVMYASKVYETDCVGLARPEVQDCKGFDTRESINKRKQVKAVHGVEVRIIKEADLTVRSL